MEDEEDAKTYLNAYLDVSGALYQGGSVAIRSSMVKDELKRDGVGPNAVYTGQIEFVVNASSQAAAESYFLTEFKDFIGILFKNVLPDKIEVISIVPVEKGKTASAILAAFAVYAKLNRFSKKIGAIISSNDDLGHIVALNPSNAIGKTVFVVPRGNIETSEDDWNVETGEETEYHVLSYLISDIKDIIEQKNPTLFNFLQDKGSVWGHVAYDFMAILESSLIDSPCFQDALQTAANGIDMDAIKDRWLIPNLQNDIRGSKADALLLSKKISNTIEDDLSKIKAEKEQKVTTFETTSKEYAETKSAMEANEKQRNELIKQLMALVKNEETSTESVELVAKIEELDGLVGKDRPVVEGLKGEVKIQGKGKKEIEKRAKKKEKAVEKASKI